MAKICQINGMRYGNLGNQREALSPPASKDIGEGQWRGSSAGEHLQASQSRPLPTQKQLKLPAQWQKMSEAEGKTRAASV